MAKHVRGEMGWLDLTVPNAGEVRNFYAAVVGWTAMPVSMGDYDDFAMMSPENEEKAVAGICHSTGSNAQHPPVWLPYFIVDDLEASLAKVSEMGGSALSSIRKSGADVYCVIRDPAGVAAALYQPAKE